MEVMMNNLFLSVSVITIHDTSLHETQANCVSKNCLLEVFYLETIAIQDLKTFQKETEEIYKFCWGNKFLTK